MHIFRLLTYLWSWTPFSATPREAASGLPASDSTSFFCLPFALLDVSPCAPCLTYPRHPFPLLTRQMIGTSNPVGASLDLSSSQTCYQWSCTAYAGSWCVQAPAFDVTAPPSTQVRNTSTQIAVCFHDSAQQHKPIRLP